jgi:hypothetical protein
LILSCFIARNTKQESQSSAVAHPDNSKRNY